jgi:hypothetical protein
MNWVGDMKVRIQWEDVGIYSKIILKGLLKEYVEKAAHGNRNFLIRWVTIGFSWTHLQN